MTNLHSRTALLIGQEGLHSLHCAHVAVVGIGGVGSFVAEALARAGVGTLTLVDHDRIDITNLNRQLHATQETVGCLKTAAMAERIAAINPALRIITKTEFLLPENIASVFTDTYDFVVDAIDTVTAKLALAEYCLARKIPFLCSMGTANKLDNTRFEITDISNTHTCPLARVMRKELRNRGITSGVTVVYSTAPAIKPRQSFPENAAAETAHNTPMDPNSVLSQKKHIPGSISYVPATAGLIIAGQVIQKLLQDEKIEI